MVESKYVLYGLISGAISGLSEGIIVYLGRKEVMELIVELARIEGNVPSKTLSYVESIANYILMFSPILYLIQMIIIGAIFGSLEDYFVKKFGLKPALAALASGSIFLIFLLGLPLATLSIANSKVLSLIVKHFGLLRILLPSAIYIATLTFLSAADILKEHVKEESLEEGKELNVEA